MLKSLLKTIALAALFFHSNYCFSQNKKVDINYISNFPNVNHPQIAYWFFSKDQLSTENFKRKIDSVATFSKYNLLFLTARNGVDFYNVDLMKPIFTELVQYAHSKGLKIGLQLWEDRKPVPIENTERIIQEDEVTLDENGNAECTIPSKHVRNKKLFIKSEIFQVKIFEKLSDGIYKKGTLQEITINATAKAKKDTLIVKLSTDKKFKNYTAYILTQHYYNAWANHSKEAIAMITNILQKYSSIPFDAVGLDEFTNLRISPTWELKNNDIFRERPYALPMSIAYKQKTGMSLEQAYFDMRYVAEGNTAMRVNAINNYMTIMRQRTLGIENEIYRAGKLYFGEKTFIGLHNTHHNYLDGDEIWQTGLNWWNVKRDIGQTDEETSTPVQMGIGMSYPAQVVYNMYYNKKLDVIWQKSLTDLRYGIRTHYHAINDIQNWGVSVEQPAALAYINKVENCARLLNNFNPSFPKIKLLVLFGMEALSNWYPDAHARNQHDINGDLNIEEKASALWKAGYLNAVVPTDVVEDGRLSVNPQGKLTLQGNKYDALLLLYPQFATPKTIAFLKDYVSKGGKLVTQGNLSLDFSGKDASADWKKIAASALDTTLSINALAKAGIEKNTLENGVLNEDGSYTFTDTTSLRTGVPQNFKFVKDGSTFSGNYTGLAVIKVDEKNNIEKFAATGFSELKMNGKTIFSLSKPADIFIETKNQKRTITIADQDQTTKIVENKLQP
jgi:hypothetical protein